LDRGRWWLAVAIGVAALVAGGLYVALSVSDGSSDKPDEAIQAEVPAASDGDATSPRGDEPSPGGQKADGNQRQDAPAKQSSTRGGEPKNGKPPGSAKVSAAEQTPPAEQSAPVGEPNELPQPPPGTSHPNRPVPDHHSVRKPNRHETKPPPARKLNRYGGQPAEGSGGRG
jgi:hypothetical protein